MLLAFDVGNSNIVLGVFKDNELITHWRMATDNAKSADEIGIFVSQLFAYENLSVKEVDDVEGLEPSEDASIFNSKMLTGEITGLEARKLILAKYNLVSK